jgi:hypothetical protein
MKEAKNAQKLRESYHYQDQDTDGRIISKQILGKYDVEM